MEDSHSSDEELMTRYQAGDARAFGALFERHSGRVLAFLQKRTAPENARELAQEVFLKVHRARHQYSSQYPFLPWLFTITRNALVDCARAAETKIARESTADVELSAPAPEGDGRRDELARALSVLPDRERRAIELRYLSEWTFERIAADMRTSPVNVRQWISRGLRKARSARGGDHD